MDQCEVSMMIPFDPMEPWLGSIIGSEPDTSVELMARITLTSLCEDPVWQQRVEALSNLRGPHFLAGMTSLARYAQYLFNLQHNTARTGMQQRTCLMAYKVSATTATREIERPRHENAILRSGSRPPSEQDCELQEVYCRLSNAEHGWNHTRMLLDITREEVDIRTHRIVHLEHHVEAQDAECHAPKFQNLECD
jgi:hypothetical protein